MIIEYSKRYMEQPGNPRPNLRIQPRILNFYFLLDTSASMEDSGRITSLNMSVKNSIPGMLQAARTNPSAKVMVHVATFGGKAEWHLHPGVIIDEFVWDPLSASGNTPMGAALNLVIDDLESKLQQRSLPPVIVLVTDGVPTDNFDKAVSRLHSTIWGDKSIRIGIGVGPTGKIGWDTLERFMYGMAFKPLHAADSKSLADYIRWSTTTVLSTATQAKEVDSVPPLPETVIDLLDDRSFDVWKD